jgi:Leucine-rich repeat (LRR) protein
LDLSSYNLTNVEEIELEDEPLTMLRLPIESMQKLSKLEIEDSKLKSFSLGPNKIDLEELDIKKNKKLESLELGALTQIKKLQIRRNPKLKSIRFNSGAPFVSEKIELEGSPNLECSCDLVDLLSIADLAVVKVEGACLSKDGGKLDLKEVTRQNCVA